MSDYLSDVLETDAFLDLLAARDLFDSDDAVLAGLACLACAVDEHPLPEPLEMSARPQQQARKCGWALSVTVALTLASSGVAAAVADDPLAPFHFVQGHITFLQQDPPSGWDLDGGRAITTQPASSRSVSLTHLHGTAMDHAGLPAFAKVRTPAAGKVAGSGSSGGGSSAGGSLPPPAPGVPPHDGGPGGGHGNGGSGNGGPGHGPGDGNGGGGTSPSLPRSPVSPKGPPIGGHKDPGVNPSPILVTGAPSPPAGGNPATPIDHPPPTPAPTLPSTPDAGSPGSQTVDVLAVSVRVVSVPVDSVPVDSVPPAPSPATQ